MKCLVVTSLFFEGSVIDTCEGWARQTTRYTLSRYRNSPDNIFVIVTLTPIVPTDRTFYHFQVQFLNREKFVSMLSEEHSLLSVLARSITDALTAAAKPPPPLSIRLRFIGMAQHRLAKLRSGQVEEIEEELEEVLEVDDGTADEELEAAADDLSNSPSGVVPEHVHRPLNCGHPILLHRRYSPCIGDLKCVLNVPGVARKFCKWSQAYGHNCLIHSNVSTSVRCGPPS